MHATSILSRSRPEGLKKTAGQKGDLREYLVRETWLNLDQTKHVQFLPENSPICYCQKDTASQPSPTHTPLKQNQCHRWLP